MGDACQKPRRQADAKTAYVFFANHFDLIWRRGWERGYEHDGRRWASYAEIQTVILDRVLALAEAGRGAYQLEQALSLRRYLHHRPDALPRLRRLQADGLFELLGGGEAIIDTNMCAFETMVRNWASGTRFSIDVLGQRPLLASHCDGFGSSAQFPQVLRGCGYRGVENLAYAKPDNDYWRGLDGSSIYVRPAWPGKWHFYDHCYHEPCRVCHGHGLATGCAACDGTGLDLPQNSYPEYTPLAGSEFRDGLAVFAVTSEEMLPPAYLDDCLRQWHAEPPGIAYVWGTQRHLERLLAAALAQADAPPPDRLSSRIENNPAQTGCLVTQIRSKLQPRRGEARFFGAEAAVAAASFQGGATAAQLAAWHELFPELALHHFHDSVTGTHQETAACELRERMQAFEAATARLAGEIVGAGATAGAAPGRRLRVFNPRAEAELALRVSLALPPGETAAGPLVAETADGRRFPVTMPWHAFGPPAPAMPFPPIHAVGSGARTRPPLDRVQVECPGLAPLAWTGLTLRAAAAPRAVDTRQLRNDRLLVVLGEHGVEAVTDLATGATIRGEEAFPIGSLRLDEDEGDPWNTRKFPAFKRPLSGYTRLLGVTRFDGYTEACYHGIFEPNLSFGREADAMIFGLEWQLTVRLLEAGDRLDFDYELFWKSANRRLRAIFPTQAGTDSGWYSIPGGWLERPRYEQTETALWSPNGDWPALYFVATQGADAEAPGWALLNYGTPAARIEDGRLVASLLRSPAFGHCLERYAQSYPMPTGNLRDAGWHHLSLALAPHAGKSGLAALCRRAAALNAQPFAVPVAAPEPAGAAWPSLHSDAVTLEAVKPVFLPPPPGVPAQAVVLRLLNLADRPAAATLTPRDGSAVRLQECNLIEEPLVPEPHTFAGQPLTLNFTPFQARSFLVWTAP